MQKTAWLRLTNLQGNPCGLLVLFPGFFVRSMGIHRWLGVIWTINAEHDLATNIDHRSSGKA